MSTDPRQPVCHSDTPGRAGEQAGVSSRTFCRYAPTKESVRFVGEYGLLQPMTKHFLDQPDTLTDLEALRETFLALAHGSLPAAGRSCSTSGPWRRRSRCEAGCRSTSSATTAG